MLPFIRQVRSQTWISSLNPRPVDILLNLLLVMIDIMSRSWRVDIYYASKARKGTFVCFLPEVSCVKGFTIADQREV